jgi:hypothetical protein
MRFFARMDEEDFAGFFDFLLFHEFLYDRLNVDLVGGKRTAAPPLLDLGIGYGYQDIRAIDRRGDEEFPSALLALAVRIAPTIKDPSLRKEWCRRILLYRSTLEDKLSQSFGTIIGNGLKEIETHTFFTNETQRSLYRDIYDHRQVYEKLKASEKEGIRDALRRFPAAPCGN